MQQCIMHITKNFTRILNTYFLNKKYNASIFKVHQEIFYSNKKGKRKGIE